MMRTADCHNFRLWFEDLNDPTLDQAFREALARHPAGCDACAEFALRHRQQRRSLRRLPAMPVPVHLAVNLRVLASKERLRRANRVDWATRMNIWRNHARLVLGNLWRPFGIPAVGGLASACFLFSALMPTFALQGPATADVPTAWYQSAEVHGLSPFGVNIDDVTLDVQIDSSGRVVDYAVPAGDTGAWNKNPELRREVENSLLFMSFKPASFFGQPASDTIRITLRRSRIEVKG